MKLKHYLDRRAMDIGSTHDYPSSHLSNFHSHPFILDGIHCASMEGFLQSLKFENQTQQIKVCKLSGKDAKKMGRQQDWKRNQMLHWQGEFIPRTSQAYQMLLDRAYNALYQTESFQQALNDTHHRRLTHTMGDANSHNTVLTEYEFISRLTKLRKGGDSMKDNKSTLLTALILLGIQISTLFALTLIILLLKILADTLGIQPFWPIALLTLVAGNTLLFYRIYKHDKMSTRQ